LVTNTSVKEINSRNVGYDFSILILKEIPLAIIKANRPDGEIKYR